MSELNCDETEFGRLTWLSSEEDSGPDVGVVLGLGAGRALFVGELANVTLEEHGLDPKDGSWWLSMYEPDDHIILGPVRNEYGARDVFDRLFATLQQSSRRLEALEEAERALEASALVMDGMQDGNGEPAPEISLIDTALTRIRAAKGGE